MAAKVGHQALPTFGRQRADFSQKRRLWQDRGKAQPKKRRRLESAGGKFIASRSNGFVKASNALVELGAHATDEEIAEGR